MISGMKMSIINGSHHQTLETLLLVVTDRSSPFWRDQLLLFFSYFFPWLGIGKKRVVFSFSFH